MQIDVAQAIKELLYKSDSVIIPGLGGLIATPVPASVDYVQGSVEPPSRKLEFNENLVINDGVLARFIEEQYTVSFREAVEAITDFVNEAREALERREIVEIPEVGRIYLDYQQQIRFMPDKTNFAVDSFGLPPVNFKPVVRERDEGAAVGAGAAAATAGAAGSSPPKPAEAAPSFVKRNLPWLVGLGAVLTAVLLFIVFSGGDSSPKAPDKDRLNVSPKSSTENQPPADDAVAEENKGAMDENNNAAAGGEGSVAEAEKPAPPAEPEVKEAFIVVHSFKNPRNANNFYNVLSEAGYRAEKRLWNGLQRVGIIFPYRYTTEIDSMKQVLGPKYKSGPKLFEELEE
jgi:hypothetical protein